MIHLTSLLMCLINAVIIVAALQNAHSLKPDPPLWEQRYGVGVRPRSFHPQGPDGIKGPQQPDSVIKPKSFSLQFEGPPSQESEHAKDQKQQSSSKPGWHLKLSLPFPTTTAAPKSEVNVNAGFFYSGSSSGKVLPNKFPGLQKTDHEKPPVNTEKQSHLVKFLNELLIPGKSNSQSNQNGQTIVQTQQDKVVFKPLVQQLSSHSYTSGTFLTQAPVQSVHSPPKWLQSHKPQIPNEAIMEGVLKYVQNVNGQLMIPVEKCPGFEKFREFLLKGPYHQHGKFPFGYVHQHDHVHQHGQSPHGYVHQHGQLSQDHVHQNKNPPHLHVHQHAKPPHLHIHKHPEPPYVPLHRPTKPPHMPVHTHWLYPQDPTTTTTTTTSNPVTAKPNYAEFFLHVGGPAPESRKPSQETNVYLSGGYRKFPINGWQKYTQIHQEPKKQQSEEQFHPLKYEARSQHRPYNLPRWS